MSLTVLIAANLTQWSGFLERNKALLGSLAVLSVVLFLGCLIIVPWLVARIPVDYFETKKRPRTRFAKLHPVLRWSGLIAKNVLGVILVLAGIAMLVLPGQGVLTLVMGIMLMDFPGKHRLERRIIRIPPVLRSVNWLRRRAGVEPIGRIG